ncbi:MAG: phosphatidylcholine synthase [Rhizobiales bacterium]|nr:phosphatidylcholine synthase [Hyphomicrobiales bacterium]
MRVLAFLIHIFTACGVVLALLALVAASRADWPLMFVWLGPYVFVPAYAVVVSGLMPDLWAIAAGAAIVLTGALYFADSEMKAEDNFFRGFPAIWNVVAFYLLLLWPPAWMCAVAIALLVVLTFAPIRFIHPLRVKRLRALNVTLLALGLVLSIIAIGAELTPDLWVTMALCALGLYLFSFGLVFGRAPPAAQTWRE